MGLWYALNGIKTKQQTFTFEELKELNIVAKFKNKSFLDTNIIIRVNISVIGHKPIKMEFSLDNLHQLNILQLVRDSGFDSSESVSCWIKTYDNNVNIINKFVKIKN